MSHTITLISAVAGDRIGQDAIELAQLGAMPAWVQRTEVQAFFAACNYGPDGDWAELMYVLTEDQGPAGWPTLQIEVGDAELAEIRAAVAEAGPR